MKYILWLLLAAGSAQADDYIHYAPNIDIVITTDQCGEAHMQFAYAVHSKLDEYAFGCWYESNGEVLVRLLNGKTYQDYRFLKSEFKPIAY